MARTIQWVKRPAAGTDERAGVGHGNAGVVLGVVGVLTVAVATIGNLVAASDLTSDPDGALETLAWTFGVNTTGFGLVKFGIAVILIGIIIRLWLRVDSVKTSLPALLPSDRAEAAPTGDIDTAYGEATATRTAPPPLNIHRMAQTMWLPMLAMGAMVVAVSLILSLVTATEAAGTEDFLTLTAWTQGLMFLGETFLLAGISFLLGTILAGLREGGGEVQESLGATVKTLKMPASAKAFVGLMMLGVMVGVLQFILYLVATGSADDPQSFSAWAAWLGPLREAGLGILLSGIVLALYTISKVLGFQFTRIRELITTGA